MAHATARLILGPIESVFEGCSVAGLADRQLLLLIASMATGAGYLTRSRATAQDKPGEAAAPRVTGKSDDAPRPAPGRMTVAGRVLDPDGKPVKGAVVDLVSRPRMPWVGASDETATDSPCWARASPTATAGSASMRPAPRRSASSRSSPWPPRPGTAWAGPS